MVDEDKKPAVPRPEPPVQEFVDVSALEKIRSKRSQLKPITLSGRTDEVPNLKKSREPKAIEFPTRGEQE